MLSVCIVAGIPAHCEYLTGIPHKLRVPPNNSHLLRARCPPSPKTCRGSAFGAPALLPAIAKVKFDYKWVPLDKIRKELRSFPVVNPDGSTNVISVHANGKDWWYVVSLKR